MKPHFILYVADQSRSTAFYSSVLGMPPTLDVPGMTEFSIGEATILGLMPEDGIVRLFGDAISHPSLARGIPHCEVYLVGVRDWGHYAAYSEDPDGHILAFASLESPASPASLSEGIIPE